MALNEMIQDFIDKQKPYYLYHDERVQHRDMVSSIKDKYKSKIEGLLAIAQNEFGWSKKQAFIDHLNRFDDNDFDILINQRKVTIGKERVITSIPANLPPEINSHIDKVLKEQEKEIESISSSKENSVHYREMCRLHDSSKFKEIDPFSCLQRTFCYCFTDCIKSTLESGQKLTLVQADSGKVFGEIVKAEIEYAGMGDHNFYITVRSDGRDLPTTPQFISQSVKGGKPKFLIQVF
ncbi:hypothetical protein QTV49_003950 [Vibrio vulnificus]|nr:hypothetical protein [Vibrio vulnificus]